METERYSRSTLNLQCWKPGGCFHYNDEVQKTPSENQDFHILLEPALPVRFLELLAPSKYRQETTEQNKVDKSYLGV